LSRFLFVPEGRLGVRQLAAVFGRTRMSAKEAEGGSKLPHSKTFAANEKLCHKNLSQWLIFSLLTPEICASIIAAKPIHRRCTWGVQLLQSYIAVSEISFAIQGKDS
jgi:hypothetical protein